MFQAGVRARYVASRFAAFTMVAQCSGLIVNINFWAAQKYMNHIVLSMAWPRRLPIGSRQIWRSSCVLTGWLSSRCTLAWFGPNA